MCGISAIVHVSSVNTDIKNCQCVTQISDHQLTLLRRRGPDYFSNSVCIAERNVEIKLCSTVLHQRGYSVAQQPLRNSLGNYLLWNGEAYAGLESTGDGNDGEELLNLLSANSNPENLLSTFGNIRGPWAFIFWENLSKRLWFGRDILGRRSLLWNACSVDCCSLTRICSVADLELGSWEEVPADGIYCLELKGSKNISQQLYPWSRTPSGRHCELQEVGPPTFSIPITHVLTETLNTDLPETEDLAGLYRIELNPSNSKMPIELLSHLGASSILMEAAKNFTHKIQEAVRIRTQNQPGLCKNCMSFHLKCGKMPACSHSAVAVLYSGGVDSIFLAVLADRCIPEEKPIDLLNVSFEHTVGSDTTKKDKKKSSHRRNSISYDSPDRITGVSGLKELQTIAPLRSWNFVEINVTKEELSEERANKIQHLIAPSKTVLDDSIGCAVWFAARGRGYIRDDSGCPVPYSSPARVVLVGMGADEQLVGYSRHRNKYSICGWKGVIEEIAMEMDRISCRNLGRDDRIISDHGREARFPFLDEDVVRYLKDLPIWLKANLDLPRGIGEKLLLRLAAASLGLTASCVLPKRAVQFGSRIARTEDKKEKGSDICKRLSRVSM